METVTVSAALPVAGGRDARRDGERGQGMVEYALILVFVAVVVILLITLLGHQTNNLFSNISSSLGT